MRLTSETDHDIMAYFWPNDNHILYLKDQGGDENFRLYGLNADKINTPLFIAQGANDPRVNKDESDQVVEALKARGVVVEYLVKDNEGHGFYNQENRFDFYRAMEKFLIENL